VLGNEDIKRIFPFRNRRDLESRRPFGRQVLQAVNGKINMAGGQCLFNFFGEHPLCPDPGERHVSHFVPGGLDNFEFNLMTVLAQQAGNVIGLPQGQL
jgi:hypothetical protein